LIPEGGANELAPEGATEIVENNTTDDDDFCVACGTGGTAAGIITGLNGKSITIGFSLLKGDFYYQEIKNWLEILDNAGLSKRKKTN